MSKSKNNNLIDQVNDKLTGTPKNVEDTKALFFTKGILLIVFGLISFLLNTGTMASWFVYLFTGLMVVNGLIMIAAAMISEKTNKSWQLSSIIVGGLSIIFGCVAMIFPYTFLPNTGTLMIIGIALDAFFTMSSMMFITKNKYGSWWAILSGLIAVIFIIGLYVYGNTANVILWLQLYMLSQGIFYTLTPFAFAGQQNVFEKIIKKSNKKVSSKKRNK